MIDDNELDELKNVALADRIVKFVVGAFIVKEGKFLILRRASTEDFLPDLQEIPSGGVEHGETFLQALHREVEEETALKVTDVMAYINCFDYLSSSGRKTREFNFWVETEGAAIRLNPAEHSEFKWVDVLSADFVELNLSQETRACVIEAHKEILGNIE